MKSFIEIIEKKIKDNIKIDNIKIIDNSEKHSKHKFFNKNKVHLMLIIESNFLKSLNRIDAHKKITKVLEDEMKNKIHSLEIRIN
tara:strand:- start:237 stop:491 length:255 start_codon:yes stop_codon:yes gene_type:complete